MKNTDNIRVISGKRIAANRANAKKSTGPRTAGGKKKSCQNAITHGITMQTTVMTEDDRIRHDAFCAHMMIDLAPEGAMENFLASSVAEEAWRLNYLRAQCNNIVSIGHFDGTGEHYDADHPEIHTAITAATTVRDNANTLQLLSLYEQRIHRAFQKYSDQLAKLQTERKAKRDEEMSDASHLMQLAVLSRLPFSPADDGFVFSTDEIAACTERRHRLALAKETVVEYRKQAGLWALPKIA